MLPLAAAGAGTNSGDAPERAAGLKSGGRSKSLSLLPNTAFYELQVLAPAAVTYQSGLLGFGAAAALYSAVGFSVLPTGLCWCARVITM